MGNFIGSPNMERFAIGKSKLKSALENAFPSYYIKDVVINDSDVDYVTKSWNLIMNCEEVEEFLKAKSELNFEYSSCLTWFFDLFYGHFFELCPDARTMFVHVSMAAQGRLLAGVISTALGLIKKPEKLRKRLIAVVDSHNPKNIYSDYYGIMGEALLWALQRVLGERFDENTKIAWVRVYSILLSIMIPRAVAYETKNNSHHSSLQRDSSFTSTSSSSNKSISNLKYAIENRIRNSLTLKRTHGAGPKSNINEDSPECPFKRSENVSINSSRLSHKSFIKSTSASGEVVETKSNDDDGSTASCPFKLSHSNGNTSVDSVDTTNKHVNLNKFLLKKASSAFGRLAFHSSSNPNCQAPGSGLESTNFSNIEDFPKPEEDIIRDPLHQHPLQPQPHYHHLHENKISPYKTDNNLMKMSVSEHPKHQHQHVHRKKIGCSKSLDSKDRLHLEVATVREEIDEGGGNDEEGQVRDKQCPYQFGTLPTSSLYQPHHSTQSNNVRNYKATPTTNENRKGNERATNHSVISSSSLSYEPSISISSTNFISRDQSTLIVLSDTTPQSELSLPTAMYLHSSNNSTTNCNSNSNMTTKHLHTNVSSSSSSSSLYGYPMRKSVVKVHRSEASDLSEEMDDEEDKIL